MGKIGAYLAIGLGLGAIGGATATIIVHHNQEDRAAQIVAEAIEEFAAQIEAFSDPMMEQTAYPEMIDTLCSEDATVTYSLDVTGLQVEITEETMQSVLGDALSGSSLLSGMLPSANDLSETIRGTTFGIDGTLQRDLSHTAVQMESAISVANKELTDVVLLASGNDIALQIPALTSQSLGWSAEDLSGQVNGSAFARQFDLTLPEGISIPLYETLPINVRMMSRLPELLARSIELYGTDFEAKYLEQTREVTIEGDDTKQCMAYEVTWQERGITLILWIDEDGMIRRIEGEELKGEGEFSGMILSEAAFNFLGAKAAAGSIEGDGRITSEEIEDLLFEIQSTFTQNEETYERTVSLAFESSDPQIADGAFSYEGSGDTSDLSFEIEAEGTYGTHEAKAVLHGRFAETGTEGWQVILTKGKFSDETGELCRVTGSIGIAPLTQVLSVTMPKQRLMLFEATQNEVDDLIAEAGGNIMEEVMRYVDALDYLKIFGF